MPLTHTNTHTQSLRTDATGPDLATSFPWGRTPDATSCLALPSSVSSSSPLVPLPSSTFILSSFFLILPAFVPKTMFSWSFHHFSVSSIFLNTDIVQEMFLLWEANCLCGFCATTCVYSNEIGLAAVRIVELWSELWCTLQAVYAHQTHTWASMLTQTGAFHPISLIRS